jgi:MoaA/NifB/PqqE/SkfB family radical SAM enzyme
MHKDLFEIISYIKKFNIDIELMSNGRMFAYQDFCDKLIMGGIDRIYVSMHDHTKKGHENITGVPGSFNQALQGIKNLLQLKTKVNLRFIITKKNIDHLSEAIAFFKEIGVQEISLVNIEPKGAALENFNENFVPLKKISDKIKENILYDGIKTSFENIPLCYMSPQYKSCYNKIPQGIVYIFRSDKLDPSKFKEEGYYAYQPKCEECLYKDDCNGIFANYKDFIEIEVFPIK